MSFNMMKPCPVCGEPVDTFKHCVCTKCGHSWNDLIDYSGDFEYQDKKWNEELTDYGLGLRGYPNMPHGYLGLEAEFAKKVFSIIKNADSLSYEGFSTSDGRTFEKLCQDLEKVSKEPGTKQIEEHKNIWDDHQKETNVFDTLGIYGIDSKRQKYGIQLDHGKIMEKYHDESIVVLTILHEIMHAAMETGTIPDGSYWYYKEEAYANAFALKLLKGSKWYDSAFTFVQKQPTGYNAAALLVEQPLSMDEWRMEKQKPEAIGEEDQQNWLNRYVKY